MRWNRTRVSSGRVPFDIATDQGPLNVWGFKNGAIGAHSPGEDDRVWDMTHLPTGLRIGQVQCDAARADYLTYRINLATGLDTTDSREVAKALMAWAAPLSVPDQLRELAAG